jgi:site-specific DNA-methyltransferase (adenine-specific)
VLFDEDAAEMLDEQSGILKSGLLAKHHKVKGSGGASGFLGESMKRDGFEKDYGGDSGGASRFFYVAKASKSERNKGCENLEPKLNDFQRESSGLSTTTIDGVRQKGNCRQPNNNHHPTVKPIKLMEYLCKLITPPGGTVLDPFMGSGTTGIAAKNIGFDFVGIEIEEEYFRIAKLRIENCFLSLERKSQ